MAKVNAAPEAPALPDTADHNANIDEKLSTDSTSGRSHDAPSLVSKSGVVLDVEKERVDDAPKATFKPGQLPPDHPMHPSQFPDGGRGWPVVFGAFILLFCSFGWINCIGVFQDYYQTHQLRQYSPSTIAWIPSVEAFFMFIGGPFIGKIYDNYGPRYLLLVGSFLHVFGIMMASISTEYYQFMLSQAICSPIGASCLFYPAMSTTATWFFKRRAFAFGCVAAGSSLGGVILPIMVFRLIPQIGFGWTMRTIAFMFLGLLVIANLTVKSRLPPRPVPFAPMEFVRPLKEPVFSLNIISSFLVFLPLLVPINFIIVQAGTVGMSTDLQQYLVPILNAASLFGRVLPGYIGDKVGRFNAQIFMSAFAGITCLALWLPANGNAPIIVFAALYGFGSGAFVSLTPSIVAQITTDISKIGVRTGTTFAVMSLAALTGNPIGGALVQRDNGGFTGVQLFCGILQIAGALLFVVTKGVASGWKMGAKC